MNYFHEQDEMRSVLDKIEHSESIRFYSNAGRENRRFMRYPADEEEIKQAFLTCEEAKDRIPVLVKNLSLGGALIQFLDESHRTLHQFDGFLIQKPDGKSVHSLFRVIHERNLSQNSKPLKQAGVEFLPEEPFLSAVHASLAQIRNKEDTTTRLKRKNEGSDCKKAQITPQTYINYACRANSRLQVFKSGINAAPALLKVTRINKEKNSFDAEMSRKGGLKLEKGEDYFFVSRRYNALHYFLSRLEDCREHSLEFVLPDAVYEGAYRKSIRADVREGPSIYVRFRHPLLREKIIQAELEDISFNGFSCLLNPEKELLLTDTLIKEAELEFPSGEKMRSACRIKHLSSLGFGNISKVGFEILGFYGEAQRKFEAEVVGICFPGISFAESEDYEAVWNLFAESGYLDEKPRSLIVPLKNAFLKTWRSLNPLFSWSKCFLYRDSESNKEAGTVSLSTLYSKTIIPHQLAVSSSYARDRRSKLQIPLRLFSAIDCYTIVNGWKYVTIYFNSQNKWHQWIFTNFAHRCKSSLYADLNSLVIWENCAVSSPPPEKDCKLQTDTLTIQEAGKDDIKKISEFLLKMRGSMIYDAFDYSPELFSLVHMKNDNEGKVINRARIAFTAKKDERLVGVMLLESAETGYNIFSLLDNCRIFFISDSSKAEKELIEKIFMRKAEKYFRKSGKKSFLYLSSPDNVPVEAGRSLVRIAPIYEWTISEEVLPEYLAYYHEIWGMSH